MLKNLHTDHNKLLLVLFIISQCIVFGFILFISPAHFIYDENNFIQNVDLFKLYGFSVKFIKSLKDQSPGPLFQIVHVFFEPITNFDPIKMRVLNYAFYLLSLILLCIYFLPKEKILIGLFLISSIPSLLTIVGIALTEMPAILMLTISLSFLKISDKQNENNRSGNFCALLGGLFLSFAISGRTQFILLIPALIVSFTGFRRSTILFYISSALIIPSVLFYFWEGLVPPFVSNLQQGLNPLYGILAFSYLFIIIYFMSYSVFPFDLKILLITLIVSVLFILVNTKFKIIEFSPLKNFIEKIFHESKFMKSYRYIAPGVLIFFILYSLQVLFMNKHLIFVDKWQKVFLISVFLICLSCIKSSAQFSSRYVLQTFPLLFIIFIPNIKISIYQIIISTLGFTLSVLSLYTYYKF